MSDIIKSAAAIVIALVILRVSVRLLGVVFGNILGITIVVLGCYMGYKYFQKRRA